jgi:hypothetical protein
MNDTDLLAVSRKNLLQNLIEAIDKRFSGDLHLFKGSSFICFKNWPEIIDDDLGKCIFIHK